MNLIKYHLLEVEDVLPDIKKELETKIDSMVNRQLYSKYKMALTKEEREKARQEYLNKREISESFRW